MPEDLQGNPQHEQGDAKENALKGVEADEAPLVVGLQHEKNDRRDNGNVGQHSGDIVCQSACGGCRCCGLTCTGTSRTSRRTGGHLRSTIWTEGHAGLLHREDGYFAQPRREARYQKQRFERNGRPVISSVKVLYITKYIR